MEDLINITISIHPNVLYKCVSMFINQQEHVDYQLSKDDDILRKILLDLIQFLSKNNINNNELLLCLSTKNVNHCFVQFLNLLQKDNHPHYKVILDYLSSLVKNSQYASIYEDADFHEQLVNLLINNYKHDDFDADFDADHVMKDYKSTKNEQNNKYDDKIKMLNLLDDDTFNNILSTLGLDEEGINKAKKIKQDVRDNKPLDFNEILKFVQDYKQNLLQSNNPLIANILNMFGIQDDKKVDKINDKVEKQIDDKKQEQAPPQFDMNNIVNMMAPFLNGMQQNRQQKRTTKIQKRR